MFIKTIWRNYHCHQKIEKEGIEDQKEPKVLILYLHISVLKPSYKDVRWFKINKILSLAPETNFPVKKFIYQ